jgi:hypothetical protein
LIITFKPAIRGWNAARGTGLRWAVGWAVLALVCGVGGQLTACGEPLVTGRPWTGHWAYVMTAMMLASLISVFNARRPGGGAWAILMSLLILVLLIPWLESAGLAKGADPMRRLRLDAPWSVFYVLLAIAGVTNYMPTRYGPAALVLAVGIALEFAGLTKSLWPAEVRARVWSGVPWLYALAMWVADSRAKRRATAASNRLWVWFRDNWGVVWALRVQERFNESARSRDWPVRLTWSGYVAVEGREPEPTQDDAQDTLAVLLRRFADRERIDAEAGLACGRLPAQGS